MRPSNAGKRTVFGGKTVSKGFKNYDKWPFGELEGHIFIMKQLLNPLCPSWRGILLDLRIPSFAVTPQNPFNEKPACSNTLLCNNRTLAESALMSSTEQQYRHSFFVRQVKEMEASHQGGSLVPLGSVVSILREWFINHIKIEDKKYAAFI